MATSKDLLRPKSCDTFVALPPATADGNVIFGKNSDRPCEEVQQVIHIPATSHKAGSKLQCTYIEIEQVPHTHSVILSSPSWLWGAEMGANEYGVCIGNEAVWTKLNGPNDRKEQLLGMDFVRLGLERGQTAKEAMDVITSLLEKYGQGGQCNEDSDGDWCYHNSFLIADCKEAWVLETAGQLWAAEHITEGIRNISNGLTIRTKIDAMSDGLKEHAQSKGFWNGEGDFDFALAYSSDSDGKTVDDCSRYTAGKRLLSANLGSIKAQTMFNILRDTDSGICMEGSFLSTGSQVSILSPPGSTSPCCHWFTATPNPSQSVFKPFIFCKGVKFPEYTVSPNFGDQDPVKVKPRFQKKVDRRHELWKAHEYARKLLDEGKAEGDDLWKTMRELEEQCIEGVDEFLKGGEVDESEVEELFLDCIEAEIKFYY
ncbi:secernin-2-like [Saccoglossus kowalevskii]|uniref:Secernin-2-like n=1 Tax=Saccoglossus kowalevskii TaxID=10224 RepID=A0ABM0GZE8_SACKO|nr:PREDICTED: secernin-2-like [Saccoglossus kowalevskii]